MIEENRADISELLKKVRKIELRTRGMVRESFGGEYTVVSRARESILKTFANTSRVTK